MRRNTAYISCFDVFASKSCLAYLYLERMLATQNNDQSDCDLNTPTTTDCFPTLELIERHYTWWDKIRILRTGFSAEMVNKKYAN